MSRLEKRRIEKGHNVGPHGLNAIAAFPLLAISLILVACVLLKSIRIASGYLETSGLFFLIYGLWLTIELVAMLYASARNVIKTVLENEGTSWRD